MQPKQALRVLGTLLFLYGAFGYIFPHWGTVNFTNNENLFHVLSGLVAIFMSNFSEFQSKRVIFILGIVYFALAVFGMTLKNPSDFHLGTSNGQLDLVDNVTHAVIALAFAWFWLSNRKV